ncbi:conserved hypothetical protein [Xylanimonas cellulosilytica DSM 15894]|uniref:Phage tail protein n=1 Tax=Xylanimonas cellulosilytica (strain DSM 15894 / JCM 12276 / CECT 5975 / KCTC 9989 / LMG 20990 / NBRC 107835 / XIL07) TaxID=446471 RepID=D1BTJ7_XYLCX|nr:phage tail protein [Xylanimonas cellulosilytica]ACZ30976.1 conserved hypothetical protein [Xylanimonas cellulosilytica DSM 15894]
MSVVTEITGLRLDPPLNHNFVVMFADTSSALSIAATVIGDVLLGGFSECSGLEMVQTDHKLAVGGRHDGDLRFPTRTTWSNLVLKRGVSRISQSGWDWLYGFGEGKVQRKDGLIILFDGLRIPHNVWTVRRAFPVKFTGPALNAVGKDVAVETLELAHEGLWQLSLLKEAAGLAKVSL